MKTDPSVKSIILKWYKTLGFKDEYDAEFEKGLDSVYVDKCANVDSYGFDCEDGVANFLHYLYFLEKMEKDYVEKRIPYEIFLDTAIDVVRWTDIWSELKGRLYLGELEWLWHILTLRIIKLGRLQFCRKSLSCDIPEYGLKKGDPVLDVHIPAAGPMTPEECERSFALCKEFFPEFYPDFDYKCFTCHSWLLDDTIADLVGYESNIMSFGRRFKIIKKEPSYAILSYTIRWKTNKDNVSESNPSTRLGKAVKEAVLNGRELYAGFGIIPRN